MRRCVWPLGIRINSGAVVVPALIVSVALLLQQTAVRFVGTYSNVVYTAEHEYGYTAELWREQGHLQGLLFVSAGLQGDKPAGRLENIREELGRLSFRAKLSVGWSQVNGKDVPARNLFTFSGVLSAGELRGVITESEGWHPQLPVKREDVVLRLRPGASPFPEGSREEWERWIGVVLQARGPKW